MDDRLNFIYSRRSIRVYREGIVTDDQVRELLEAGMAAPSAVAKDPWRFIVVREKKNLNAIADGLPHGQMLRDAAVGLVVCGDLKEAHDRQLSYLLQDCSAAIQNILLAAGALGLGACWLGIHPREDRITHIRRLFRLPLDIIPVSAISIGWPGETKSARTRYTESSVHHEKW